MDIPAILTANYPGAEWSLNGDDYAGLDWLSDTPKPTKKTLEKAWPEVQQARQLKTIQDARAVAYAQTADPLFFKFQRGEVTEQEWLDAVQAVKDAHPYPEVAE